MQLKIIISEQEGNRVISANFHDMELSKTKIEGGHPVLFQFESDDTPRHVYMRLSDVAEIGSDELMQFRSQRGHIYAKVKTLNPVLNPPTFLTNDELISLFKMEGRRARLDCLIQIKDRAEELGLTKVVEMTKMAMASDKIHDSVAAVLIKFYNEKVTH